MPHAAFRPTVLSVALAASLWFALPGEAGQRPAPSPGGRPASAEQAVQAVVPDQAEEGDADRIRRDLTDVLQRYPPAVGRVLKLDPALMSNPSYLEPYPALRSFLAEHPAVAHNPSYFLETVRTSDVETLDPRRQDRRDFLDLLGNFAAFLVFLVVTGVLTWLIRLFVEHRRWNRLSKIQTDVHTKLLDRFTSNEDLLAYIQTPAGRRFLESAPIPLQDESRPIGAPFSRILWSVQAGVVLAVSGLGVMFVSTRFADEAAQFFFVIGVVTLALGGGFILSAFAAYLLSRRLGLVETPASDHA